MEEPRIIGLIAYAFFTGLSLFLSALLLIRHKQSGNGLLAVVLLLLTARVGKSILSLAFLDWALPVNVVGLFSMAALGPFLLFYVKGLFTISQVPAKSRALHLLPAFICLGAWTWPMISLGYYAITAQLLGYLVYTSVFLYRNSEMYAVDNVRWKWSKGVVLGLGMVLVTFIIQILVYVPVLYFINVGLSVAVLYALSLWAVRQNRLFVESPKRIKDLEDESYVRIGDQVRQLMEEEVFIDTDLKLSKLANRLDIQPYLLSKAINSYFKMSFSELILSYRVRKAEELLLSPAHKAYTIEAIAYESGFQTLSAFYHAFKKINDMTPTQYRERTAGKAAPEAARRYAGANRN